VSCSTAIFADEVLNPYLKKANVDNSKRNELLYERNKITKLSHFNVNANSQCEGYSIAISNAIDYPPSADKDDNSREIVFDLILQDTKVWGDGPWLQSMWKRHVSEKSRTKNAHDIQIFADVLKDAFDKFTNNGKLRDHFQFDKLEDCEKNKSKILSIPAIKSSIEDAKKFLSDVKPYCMKRRDAEITQPTRELSPIINDFGSSDGRVLDKRAIPLPKESISKPAGAVGK
jgi:hypothetical protein